MPDPKHGLMGRQRSVHNTYFTLPVLFTMISNHYAGLYGHEWNWVLLLMISIAGALIRVWFVQRHKGNANPLVLRRGLRRSRLHRAARAAAAERRRRRPGLLRPRCSRSSRRVARSCHAAKPTQEGFAAPPKGVHAGDAVADPRDGRGDQPAGRRLARHAARQHDEHHRCRAPHDCALVQGRRTIGGMNVRSRGLPWRRLLTAALAAVAIFLFWTQVSERGQREAARGARDLRRGARSGPGLGHQRRLRRPAPPRRALPEARRRVRPHHQAGLSAPGAAAARCQGRRPDPGNGAARRRRDTLRPRHRRLHRLQSQRHHPHLLQTQRRRALLSPAIRTRERLNPTHHHPARPTSPTFRS